MNKEQKEILCKNIRNYRNKLNITQEQLAEKLGYTKQNISNWETGKNIPDDENIEEMAKLFGINKNDLLSKSVQPSYSELELVEIISIPYKISTYFLFFKNNVEDIWSAWLYDMDYPTMLLLGTSCARHNNYLLFKNNFMNNVDEWVTKARDVMDSMITFEDTMYSRKGKEEIEQIEEFADNPERFRREF